MLAVKRSLCLYYLNEMSYEEGERDMVTTGICISNEHKIMYEKLGRHTGSYQELRYILQLTGDSIESLLDLWVVSYIGSSTFF